MPVIQIPNVMLKTPKFNSAWFHDEDEHSYDHRGVWHIPTNAFQTMGWEEEVPAHHHFTYLKYLTRLNPNLPILHLSYQPSIWDYRERSLSIGHEADVLKLYAQTENTSLFVQMMNHILDDCKYLSPSSISCIQLLFHILVECFIQENRSLLDVLEPYSIRKINNKKIVKLQGEEGETGDLARALSVMIPPKIHAEQIGFCQHQLHRFLSNIHTFQVSHDLQIEPHMRFFLHGYDGEKRDLLVLILKAAQMWMKHYEDRPHLVVLGDFNIQDMDTVEFLQGKSNSRTRFFIRPTQNMNFLETSHYQSMIQLALPAHL
jgi:hypothetical protein